MACSEDAVLSRLHWAAYSGDLEAVRHCLLSGDDIHSLVDLPNANSQLVVGVTPLYLAAQQGHQHICEYLLDNGADIMRQCAIPATGEVFGPADIALVHFHFKCWWFLSSKRQMQQGKLLTTTKVMTSSSSTSRLIEPLLI